MRCAIIVFSRRAVEQRPVISPPPRLPFLMFLQPDGVPRQLQHRGREEGDVFKKKQKKNRSNAKDILGKLSQKLLKQSSANICLRLASSPCNIFVSVCVCLGWLGLDWLGGVAHRGFSRASLCHHGQHGKLL